MANPIATVLSAAMMLRLSLGQAEGAQLIEDAVSRVLAKGLRTADIAEPGADVLTCTAMTKAILDELN
jgi:3-isopropylmalate dehydrogenase